MWQLRLIIVLIGLVFIALVYLLSRQRKGRRALRTKAEPSLGGVDDVRLPDDTGTSIEPAPAAVTPAYPAARAPVRPDPVTAHRPVAAAQPANASRQLIVVLHVTGRDAADLDGRMVLAALQANGLQYGEMHVFHRMAGVGGGVSVFSVANMVEPGELDPERLAEQRITGLTLFLVLPGPADAVAACADMIATARALAAQLQGEVHNENRTPFTVEDAQRIRQRVLEFRTSP